jgi:hemolysin activation/secretion protein
VVVAASAQLASGPLLASEEFALGGARFGRGYDGGEISGDEGIAGLVELRFDGDVDWEFLEKYRIYGFFDAGSVWNIQPGSDLKTSLSSAGGGLKLFLPYDIEAGAEIAVPLTYRGISNRDRDPQVFFGVSKAFKFN